MSKVVCPTCELIHGNVEEKCPSCKRKGHENRYDFKNSDDFLNSQVPKIIDERKASGLEGLVGGLEAIIINTESARHEAAVNELLATTGFNHLQSFEDEYFRTTVLGGAENSSDILIRSRKSGENPFLPYNERPRAIHLPNTRLETFIFSVRNIEKYIEIQKSQGVEFVGDTVHGDDFSFAQTLPSKLTGNSVGVIQWHGGSRNYAASGNRIFDAAYSKPDLPFLSNIRRLDHTATRVRAAERDAAIIEFMRLTNYHFDFAIYVRSLNSITNVARLSAGEFAMVFTSGISPFSDSDASGPTENFTYNFGTRVHHMAFETTNIEDTFTGLKDAGMEFLLDLIGSPEEGLKQTFSIASPNTLLVNEYIHRYGDFDGFFTKSNVTVLTESTQKQ